MQLIQERFDINIAVNCSKSCDTVILVKKGHSESAVVFLIGEKE